MKKNVQTKLVNKAEKQAATDIILLASKRKIKYRGQLLKLQKQVCEKYKINFISNPKLLVVYKDFVEKNKIEPSSDLFQILRKCRVRTQSGIASLAVLTKPYRCPGNCLFCPTQEDVPKSYINNEPAVMRAILAHYDPIEQVKIRLRGMELAGNAADKIELIVMGGTFSYLPTNYQLKFIISCFAACNRFGNKLQMSNLKCQMKLKMSNDQLLKFLKKEQKKNEMAKYRIIGLTLETRPDYINKKEIKWFRELGCTRVEIGVQSIYDDVLKLNRRGHDVEETAKATKLLKDAGFKICYHMMPNLYGSNLKKDLQMFKNLFTNPLFQPDMIKIYPCVVTKYADLAKIYKQKKYQPYTDEELIKLLIDIKRIIPPYVRIQRLIRDIPKQNIIAGSKISNLRQIIQSNSQSQKDKSSLCQCIRCREIREDTKLPVKLNRIDYNASDGKEIFLQYVDKDNRLYALLRLRINNIKLQNEKCKTKVSLRDDFNLKQYNAIIREVHTYGPMLELGVRSSKDPQHTGLGKKIIAEAEKIANKEFGCEKIAVISGIGVRNYYRKFGYRLNNTYMVKKLK